MTEPDRELAKRRRQKAVDADQAMADLDEAIGDREQAIADREQLRIAERQRLLDGEHQVSSDATMLDRMVRRRRQAELDAAQALRDAHQDQLDAAQTGRDNVRDLVDHNQDLLDSGDDGEPLSPGQILAADAARQQAALRRVYAARRRAQEAARRAEASEARLRNRSRGWDAPADHG